MVGIVLIIPKSQRDAYHAHAQWQTESEYRSAPFVNSSLLHIPPLALVVFSVLTKGFRQKFKERESAPVYSPKASAVCRSSADRLGERHCIFGHALDARPQAFHRSHKTEREA